MSGDSDMSNDKSGKGKKNGKGNNAPATETTAQNVTEQTNMSEQPIEQPDENIETTETENTETTEAPVEANGKKRSRKIVPLPADDPRIPEEFRQLVADKHLIAAVGEVGAKKDAKKGEKAMEASAPYIRLVARTPEVALLLSGGRLLKDVDTDEIEDTDDDDGERPRGMLDHFNYAFDLYVRGKIRNTLLQGLEGPDKAIERAVKGMLGTGLDRAEAIDLVVSSMKRKGKLPEDYVYSE